jgi:hypothetical protein
MLMILEFQEIDDYKLLISVILNLYTHYIVQYELFLCFLLWS